MFVNQSDYVGILISSFTANVTGSLFITLLFIIIMSIMLAMMFRLPIEASSILVIPLMIVILAYYGNVMPVVGGFLIFLGIILSKAFFFR